MKDITIVIKQLEDIKKKYKDIQLYCEAYEGESEGIRILDYDKDELDFIKTY